MEIRLAYAQGDLALEVPDWVDTACYGLSVSESQVSLADFADAIDRAQGRRWLDAASPLLIVNDGHRSTPTVRILEWLDRLDRINPTFLDRVSVLIACGTHSAPTEEHLLKIFGPYLDRMQARLSWHDCTDLSSMTRVGEDRFGKPVYLNTQAVVADQILMITSVEPHYFAGFTGGRKSLFPGLTDRATIERNMANSLECQPLRLEGNPMSEHLDELLRLFDISKVIAIQLVVDASQQVRSIYCGDINVTFREAVRDALKIFGHDVAEPFDVILAEVRPPLSGTLYQVQKGLENCQAACVDGGTVVVVAACQDGIGKRDFYDQAANWDREKNLPRDGVPRLGSHKLSRVNAMTRRIKVRVYSELPDDQPRRVFYEPVHDLKALFDECLHENDRNRLAVVYDAGHTVLKLAGAPTRAHR